jgi:integrase
VPGAACPRRPGLAFTRAACRATRGVRYPPDPPTVGEIIAVMRAAGDGPEAMRLRGVMNVLSRAGLRISEALALAETDLDHQRGVSGTVGGVPQHRANGHDRPRPMDRRIDRDDPRVANTLARCGAGGMQEAIVGLRRSPLGIRAFGGSGCRETLPPCRAANGHW